MSKTNMHWGVIATATLTMAGAMISAPAVAGSKAQHHAEVAHMSSKVDALEAQLQAMQSELSSLRAAQNRPSAESAKVQELDAWAQSVKAKPDQAASKDHLFSVRGGWMHFNDNRDSTDTLNGALNGDNFTSDKSAFYYGGAIDFNVNNDLFGLMKNTSFALELGVEYAHLADGRPNGVGGTLADVNQLRINASPKVKFLHGSKFRPWLIPAGLDINIISPPSSSITVLNTGMQFGAGADYEILKGIVIGADGRYHHSFDDIDGVDTDGFTLGGSVGFKF